MGLWTPIPDSFPAFLFRQLWQKTPRYPAGLDLTGRRILITGGNTGVGFECAKQLLGLHADVVLVVRTEEKGNAARQALFSACQGMREQQIEVQLCEAASFASVLKLGETLNAQEKRLDAVILNAGLNPATRLPEWQVSEDGYEIALQVNLLSPALLSLLLLPVLRRSAENDSETALRGRMLFVNSDAHAWGSIADDRGEPNQLIKSLNDKSLFEAHMAYNNTKLLLMSWTRTLAERLQYDSVTVASATPGLCRTAMVAGIKVRFVQWLCTSLAREPEDGARAIVHPAVVASRDEAHGMYYRGGQITAPCWVFLTDRGNKISSVLWKEVTELLEDVKPGITECLEVGPATAHVRR